MMLKFKVAQLDTTLTEAEVVRLGYKHGGVVGLVESIKAMENAGFTLLIEGVAGATIGGVIGSTVAPGIGTKIGQTLGSAIGDAISDDEDEIDESMTEGVGDFLKKSLEKLKGGKLSDDDFDKFYAEKVAAGEASTSDLAGKFRREHEVKPSEGSSVRGVSMPSMSGYTRRLSPVSKPEIDKSSESTLSTEDRAKKVQDYRKMFRMDIGKFKKILEQTPELVFEFKDILDEMTKPITRKYDALSEAETAPAQPAKPAQPATQQPAQPPQPVAQPTPTVAPAPAQPSVAIPASAPKAPAKVAKFEEPKDQPTVNDVIKQGVGKSGLAQVQKRNAPVINAVQKAGQVAQAAIQSKG